MKPEKHSHLTVFCIVLAAVILTTVMLWPAPVDWTGTLWGGGGDAFQYPWNFFWIRSCLFDQECSIWNTPLLSAPNGTSLYYHDLSLLNCLLFLLLPGIKSGITGHNVLMFLHTILSLLGMYLLTRSEGHLRATSFFAGTAFAFSSYRVMHMHGHLSLATTEFLPLYFWSLKKLMAGGKPDMIAFTYWRTIPPALIFTAAFLSHHYYAVQLLIGSLVFIPFYCFDYRNLPRLRVIRSLSIAGVLAILLSLPVTIPLIAHRSDYQAETAESVHYLKNYSADLLHFVMPSPFHPIWGDTVRERFFISKLVRGSTHENSLNPTFTLLFVAIAGALFSRKNLRWTMLGLTGFLLSLGPHPVIQNNTHTIKLPFYWLQNLSLFSFHRVPCRFASLLLLSACVLGSAQLSSWMRRSRNPILIIFPAQLLILFEMMFVPYRAEAVRIPGTVTALAATADRDAVFYVINPGRDVLLHQTFHRHPISSAPISRVSDHDNKLRNQILTRIGRQFYLSDHDIIKRRPALDFVFSDTGFGYILCPKSRSIIMQPDSRPVADQLKELFSYKVVEEDPDRILFAIPSFEPDSVFFELGGGWSRIQNLDDQPGRFPEPEGELIIHNPRHIPIGIDLSFSLLETCHVEVLADGRKIASDTLVPEFQGDRGMAVMSLNPGFLPDRTVLRITASPSRTNTSDPSILLTYAGISELP